MSQEALSSDQTGKYYDIENQALVEDIEFYLAQAQKIKGPTLEIACGTGRITLPLAQAGVDIVGLDISESMLSQARQKAKAENLTIEWVKEDCRSFSLNRKFDLIFIPFNSLQCLYDRESLENFFICVKNHLSGKGRFVF